MSLDICKDFITRQTANGLLLVTPLRYDDGDQITVFAERVGRMWKVHDNGEAALRLMFDGVDPDAPRIQNWLSEQSARIRWDDALDQIESDPIEEADIVLAAFKVAQAAAQLQAFSALRTNRHESVFKGEIVALLKQISEETGVAAQFDAPLDENQLLVADCRFSSSKPVAIIIANSIERLLEAELAFSHLRRIGDNTQVLAVVENAKSIGHKQIARANYFTDKTYEYQGFERAFHGAITDTLH